MNFINKTILLSLVLVCFSCEKKGNTLKMDNGLIIEEIIIGDGQEAKDYNKVVVNYTGTLEDGSVFDS